ncbi:MAG: putative fatty-acid--CoA ligase [Solirubrobacterales bacterium]|nr:putative fatty-acid--CoA ligase [Solirubrobacterales bacterium]
MAHEHPVIVPDLLNHAARRYPDRTCVTVEGRTATFAEVSARAAALAGHLQGRGLAGRRVAVLAYNELELIEIRAGVPRAGAVLVPLNYRLSTPELIAALTDADADLLLVGPGLEEVAAQLPVAETLVLGESGSYAAALAAATPQPVPAALAGAALGMINYTSGTTGRAKGVMLSNAALHATLLAMSQEMAVRPGSVYMSSNPMFHVGAAVAYGFTYLGGTCLQLRKFDSGQWLEHLHAGDFTHGQLVPTMIHDLLEIADGDAPALERLMYGSAPMPPELARRTYEAWGCELVNGFGSTESMGVSMLTPEEHDPDNAPHLLASVGRSSPGMTWKLLGDDGNEVAVGDVGEVAARGANVMDGYWRNPEATAEALHDGWMHMGDLGYRDEAGYLYLVDRRGDKIVTGGENVYPSEVENVLAEHPAIAEAAIVGLPHDRWGEAVTAVVVTRPGHEVGAEDLVAFCREQLAGYKTPKDVRFADALPRTATGKLRRGELRRTLS